MDYFESDAPSQLASMLTKPSDFDAAIVSKSTVKFRPQGGSVYNDNSRNIQFRLSSSDYADLSTLKFGFKCTRALRSQIPEDLYALTCIENIMVSCGGVVIEDIRGVRALKPLIYAGVDASYLQSDLTFAGSYKYVPTYNGILSMNRYAEGPDDVGGTGTLGSMDTFNNVNVLANGSTLVQVETKINELLGQRANTPYGVFLAHPASTTAHGGLDCGAAGIKVPGPAQSASTNYTAFNNYTATGYFGSAVLRNSMPLYRGSIEYAGSEDLSQTYELPMKLLLGLCRQGKSYFPLRNVGSLTLDIVLSPYKQQWIHVVDLTQDPSGKGTNLNGDAAQVTARANVTNANTTYTLSNLYMSCDIVRASDAVVSRIDTMCSSEQGYSIPFDTYSVITTPFSYAEQVSFTYTRAFSKLKNIYISFVDQTTSQCTQLSKSDTYLGSRYVSSDLQVGSTNMPVTLMTGPAEAYSELMKALEHMGTTRGSVVDRSVWLGKRSEFCEQSFCMAGHFPNILQQSANDEAALKAASGLNTQAPSCALWGHSLERVLARGGMTYGSGISTRAAGMSVTHNFTFKKWEDIPWYANSDAPTNPRFLDAHLGAGSRMLAQTVFHVDGLLRIASDAVSVSH